MTQTLPSALPIDAVLPEIATAFAERGQLVLHAPPGAGKTTRVPAALLEVLSRTQRNSTKSVIVLEPRRLAARLAAQRVAAERGEAVGGTVGYEIRNESVVGAKTRLLYVTEGILTRRILGDPDLTSVGLVILDEFHERHLHSDFALAWIKHLKATSRRDLGVVVMSATLETDRVSAFLGAPVVSSAGRTYPVSVAFDPEPDPRPVEQRVASAVHGLLSPREPAKEAAVKGGDILVFLPGAAEIRRSMERCASLAERHGLSLVPLHGDLPASAQDEAIRQTAVRKVIFATNVAESSVTIPGVSAVVDSGLARVATHDPWSGRVRLEVAKVSQASAAQRAGRAGRTGPGVALRLFTKGDHDTRPEHDLPELLRSDLAELTLWLRAVGVLDAADLDWLDPPPEQAVNAAMRLLGRLGAVDAKGLTDTGRDMLRFPLPPRPARLLVEAERLGIPEDGAIAAALLSEGRDLYARDLWGSSAREGDEASDLSVRIRDLGRALGERDRARRSLGFDPAAVSAVERTSAQLVRLVRKRAGPGRAQPANERPLGPDEADTRLRRAVLFAYPDRVAKRKFGADTSRLQTGRDLLLCNGGMAVLSESSQVRTAPWVVALEVVEHGSDPRFERPGTGTGRRTLVWLASAIEPEWLLDLPPSDPPAIVETVEVTWNGDDERVDAVERMLYDRLVLDESPAGAKASDRIKGLLVERAMAAGLATFAGGELFERLRCRLGFVCDRAPDLAGVAGLCPLDQERLRALLVASVGAKRSFAELRSADLLNEIRCGIGHGPLAKLDALAPERTQLGGGRQIKIAYEPGRDPWIASRLQDFFGARETPRILAGRQALVLHLLAPNHRAVQVTTDLAGFWERTYPGVRSELMRRYPRHAWPIDPLSASPPAPRAKRSPEQE